MYQIKGTAFLTTWTWLCRSPCAPVAVIFFSLFQCPGIAPFPFPGFGKRLINSMFCVKKPTSGDIAAGEEMKSLKPGAGKKGTSQHPLSSPMQTVRKTVTELWPLLQILPLAMYRHQDRRAAQITKEPEKAPSGWDDAKSLATWPRFGLRRRLSSPPGFISISNDDVTLFPGLILLHNWVAKS